MCYFSFICCDIMQVGFTLSQATKALRESRGIALLYFRPLHQKGVRGQCRAPAAPYPRERPGTHCTGGWVGLRAGLDWCGKSRPHRYSIPGPSSPQAVRYPAPHVQYLFPENCAFFLLDNVKNNLDPERPQITIKNSAENLRVECWMTKTRIQIFTQYLTLAAFPRQQCLREPA